MQSTLLIVCLSTLVVALASAAPKLSDDDVLVELSVASASLSGFAPNPNPNNINALLRIYAINALQTPSLPVDLSNLGNVIFSLYTTLAAANQTATPTFDDSFVLPSPLFTPQSIVVVELWNMTQQNTNPIQPGIPMFLGGTALTAGQVKQLPHNDSLVLNGLNNQPVGLVNLTWQ